MDEKVYRHTKMVFWIDALLVLFYLWGVVSGVIHLMRLMSESLTIGDKHLKLKTGILSNNELEIPYNKINSISVKQGLIARLLGFGSIVIYTGNDVSGIVFKQLNYPSEIKKAIQEKIDTINSPT